MKLKNFLIVVNDIERAITYYKNVFGLEVEQDNDGNVVFNGGLVLQQASIWKSFIQKDITFENNTSELYFEEADIETFIDHLKQLYPNTKFVHPLMKHTWGQQVIRFYDLDGNLIEVGTPMV